MSASLRMWFSRQDSSESAEGAFEDAERRANKTCEEVGRSKGEMSSVGGMDGKDKGRQGGERKGLRLLLLLLQ